MKPRIPRKRRPAKITVKEGHPARLDGCEYVIARIKGRGRKYLLTKTKIDDPPQCGNVATAIRFAASPARQ